MDAGKVARGLMILTTSMVAAASVVYLQSKFDEADRKAALSVVQLYKPKEGRSVPEVLDERYPGRAPVWSTLNESSCYQHVRVRASVAADAAKPVVDYDFDVDINGPSIHPANPAGEQILSELDRPPPTGSAAPAPQTAPSALSP